MPRHLCETCGVQYADTPEPPDACPICEDERQYVGHDGQRWTTLAALGNAHRARVETQEPSLTGIGLSPGFAIGQRALLWQGPAGNLLWDCTPLVDAATVEAVAALGGVASIAISHPHFHAAMADWADAFDAPIHLHADCRRWVQCPHPRIAYWEGERLDLGDGTTLLRTGGHFAGSAVCHWAAGADGRGALLTGDSVQVVADRDWVGFMRSYPNLIPLSGARVRRIRDVLAPWPFERLYGGWWERVVTRDAAAAVQRSAARYLEALDAD